MMASGNDHGGGYGSPLSALAGITQVRDPEAAAAALRMIAEGVAANGVVPAELRGYLVRAIRLALKRDTPEDRGRVLLAQLRLKSAGKTNAIEVARWVLGEADKLKRQGRQSTLELAKDAACSKFGIERTTIANCLRAYRAMLEADRAAAAELLANDPPMSDDETAALDAELAAWESELRDQTAG